MGCKVGQLTRALYIQRFLASSIQAWRFSAIARSVRLNNYNIYLE